MGGLVSQSAKLASWPLTNFSDLSGKFGALDVHDRSASHRQNVTKAADFITRMEHPQQKFACVVQTASQREVERNRAVLGAIVETLSFAAAQNISLRGHREQGELVTSGGLAAENDGNFRGLLRLRRQV